MAEYESNSNNSFEVDPSKFLESDVYPMTASKELSSLISQAIAEKRNPEPEPFQVDPAIFTSAFKFLKKYQNKTNEVPSSSLSSSSSRPNLYDLSLSSSKLKSKCITVYSTPCDDFKSRRPKQQSTELPLYVKKMMEKDVSLRRLLKTGTVTISLTSSSSNKEYEDSSQNMSNINRANNNSKSKTKNTKFEQKYGAGANLLKSLAKKATVSLQPESLQSVGNDCQSRSSTTTKLSKYTGKVQESRNPPVQSKKDMPHLHKASGNKALQNRNTFQKGLSSQKLIFPSTSSYKTKLNKSALQICHRTDTSSPSNYDPDASHQNGSNQVKLRDEFDISKFLEVSFKEEENDEHRRKYSCPHCVKKFCWSTDLKRHILTHTGERPFKCDFCTASFTRKFLMQKHARKHHQEEFLSSISDSKKQSQSNSTTILSNINVQSPLVDFEIDNSIVDNDYSSGLIEPDYIGNDNVNEDGGGRGEAAEDYDDENELDLQQLHEQILEFEDDDEEQEEILEDQYEDIEMNGELEYDENTSNYDNNLNIGHLQQQSKSNHPPPPPLRRHDDKNYAIDSFDNGLMCNDESITNGDDDHENTKRPAPIVINVVSSLHANSVNNGFKNSGPPPLQRYSKINSNDDEQEEEEDDDDEDEEDEFEGEYSTVNSFITPRKINQPMVKQIAKADSINHQHHAQTNFSPLASVQS